jgi:antitoxin ChpS
MVQTYKNRAGQTAMGLVRKIVESVRRRFQRKRKRRYTLAELLAQTDYSQERSREEQEWLDSPPVGREII